MWSEPNASIYLCNKKTSVNTIILFSLFFWSSFHPTYLSARRNPASPSILSRSDPAADEERCRTWGLGRGTWRRLEELRARAAWSLVVEEELCADEADEVDGVRDVVADSFEEADELEKVGVRVRLRVWLWLWGGKGD